MMNTPIANHRLMLSLVTAFALGLPGAAALAQSGLSGGERIYLDKGGCNQCHGSNGDGVGDDARESGANLRESALDKETMIEVISCGRPGTNMPYFEKFSYTDDRCYGMTAEDIGEDKPQPPLRNFLPKRDIEKVADYILETFVGKGSVDPTTAKEPTKSTVPAAH
jgi:mono/diheme cytochrome c family protein